MCVCVFTRAHVNPSISLALTMLRLCGCVCPIIFSSINVAYQTVMTIIGTKKSNYY